MSQPMRLTQSAQKSFQNCRKQYYYRYIQGLKLPGPKPALDFGSLIHDCLEAYHGSASANQNLMHACLVVLPRVFHMIGAAYPNRHQSRQEREDWHKARAMMAGYMAAPHEHPWEVIALEHQFDHPLLDVHHNQIPGWFLSGKIDGIVRHQGRLWLLEHKTTTYIGKHYFEQLRTDLQIHSYALECEKFMGEKPVGVIYNALRKTKMQFMEGETDVSFATRLAEVYADPSMFRRQYYHFDKATLREVIRERLDVVAQLQRSLQSGVWTRNRSRCFDWGRPCDYFALCKSHENPADLSRYERVRPHEELTAKPMEV